MANSIAVANTFINLARQDGEYLTPLRLVKLVYIAHGWSLALRNSPLIDDPVEAWQFGPVVPPVYFAFKGYGREPIKEKATVTDPLWGEYAPEMSPTEEGYDLLENVWRVYKKFTAAQLSTMTHQSNTPWAKSTNNGAGYGRAIAISNDVIRSHYEELRRSRK